MFFLLTFTTDRNTNFFVHSLKDFYDVYREQGRVHPNTRPIFSVLLFELVGFFQSEYKSGCYIYLYIFFSLIVG
jgi:hypothetical protein